MRVFLVIHKGILRGLYHDIDGAMERQNYLVMQDVNYPCEVIPIVVDADRGEDMFDITMGVFK